VKKQVLVIAPHPDDETLGCGGTLLRHVAEGDWIHWLTLTEIQADLGYSRDQVERRKNEIEMVAKRYAFQTAHHLAFATTKLDTIPISRVVEKVGAVFKKVNPEIVYLPWRNDIHTDHKYAFDATVACCKWFRYNSIKRVLAYETLSETEFGLNPDASGYRPNVFMDIADFLESKIEILNIYSSEMGEFPFPRSEDAVRSLAAFRGVAAGYRAAESFVLLKEIL